ncbi:MAG: hypothetical protein AB7F89_16295, partial [Pirellulaceae bacterium]
FTIHAEKCPNRRGVEEVVRHFMGDVVGWQDWLKRVPSESFDAVWITGGYPEAWPEEQAASVLGDVPLRIVQDCFDSTLWQLATWRLPGATFAEREGSFVNQGQWLQSFPWAIRSPAGATVEGHVYWRLLQRPGLYQARQVLAELAAEIPFFQAAAAGVPDHGVQLAAAELVTGVK